MNYAVLWCLVAEIMNVLQPGRVTTNPALPYRCQERQNYDAIELVQRQLSVT